MMTSGSPVRSVLALSRAEGRRVTRSPWFFVGLAMALLGFGMFGVRVAFDVGVSWSEDSWTAVVGILFLGVFTMVALSQAVLRDRHEGTLDQITTLPVRPRVRVGGTLLATVWPVVVVGAFVATIVLVGVWRLDADGIDVLNVLQGMPLVALLGALGVAIAVWFPTPFAVAVAALAFVVLSPGEVARPWHAAFPFVGFTTARLVLWHAVYLVGLTCFVGACALARFGARRWVVTALLVSAAVVVSSLVVLLGGVCPAQPAFGPCRFS